MKNLTILKLAAFATVVVVAAACSDSSEVVAEPDSTPVPAPTATEIPETTATTEPPTPAPTSVPTPTATPEPTSIPIPPTPEPTAEATVPPEHEEDTATEGRESESSADESTEDHDTGDEEAAPDIEGADGAAVFSAACASCHGADGSGTSRGPTLAGIGQFFTTDASPIVGLVTNGGTNMPEFGSKLTTDDIDAVVQYVVDTFQGA